MICSGFSPAIAASAATGSEITYVLNTNTKKFHLPDCREHDTDGDHICFEYQYDEVPPPRMLVGEYDKGEEPRGYDDVL